MVIEKVDKLDERCANIVSEEFRNDALKKGESTDFMKFAFLAKENEEIVGVLTGHAAYEEVHISDLVVVEKHRGSHIGSALLEAVESCFRHKGYQNINLTTYAFQALSFYQKNGFQIEFTRENKAHPSHTKYFLIKYL